jgi:hypothetical protein
VKPTYSNDRKAPRMKKGQFSKMVVTKDLWKRFREEFPEYEAITWRDFYDTWLEIAERIRHHCIYNPLGVKMGAYTGELKFQYLPHDYESRDFRTSELLGHKVKHLNLAQKGKVPKIKWERRWAVKFNKILQFYAFDETREINNLAYKYIEEESPELRTSRNTLGGHSVWRQKIRNNDKKTSN